MKTMILMARCRGALRGGPQNVYQFTFKGAFHGYLIKSVKVYWQGDELPLEKVEYVLYTQVLKICDGHLWCRLVKAKLLRDF